MPTATVTLKTAAGANPLAGTRPARERVRNFSRLLNSAVFGLFQGRGVYRIGTAQATGTITISGTDQGTYTTTINGVGINATGGADDTATAAAIAAAINASANALVADIVEASSSAGVVTITAIHAGKTGNAITLAATAGTGATASGARLTGGTETSTAY